MVKRANIIIKGSVQGVGFRPFVYRLATELELKGWIVNSSQGVFIDAEGEPEKVENFLTRLKSDRPAISRIQSFESSLLEPFGYNDFEIRESDSEGAKTALVLPDIATCPDCLEEIFDPANRRYLYPFTNCTNCGPRYSIISKLPYDRQNTTMSEFEMCDDCRKEYEDPLNRRFHAEPTACPNCGPHVELLDSTGKHINDKNEAILNAAELIKQGYIVALKGIGGYQLLADARNDEAVRKLRERKHRSEKPFALMLPDIERTKQICELTRLEEDLLGSVQAPIVLLRKKKNTKLNIISNEVSGSNPYLGVMLPYSPLHHILMKYLNIPVICTSGNISEEPICIDETGAFDKLNGIADYYLIHNRKILRHVDDSIIREAAGKPLMIRRARGYAPYPVVLPEVKETVLAVGAHLKNTVALNKGSNVFISQHIGDLENTEAINAFERVISDIKSFYEITPNIIISDMHPDYVSTNYADRNGKNVHKVQHHFAHVLACMAEHGLDENVLGVSWDGTGYGTDGTIWGSEFLIPNGKEFTRLAHFKYFPLPGGEQAIHQVWRIGFSLLYNVFGESVWEMQGLPLFKSIPYSELRLINQMIDRNINSPLACSAGRLFDGVASILGIRQTAAYEAQAAMELEFSADGHSSIDYFEFEIIDETSSKVIDWSKMIRGIVNDLQNGIPVGLISAKFHSTMAQIILCIAKIAARKNIVLTGGCFLNKRLLESSISLLKANGFEVYGHSIVPTGDGGVSLGQMKYAAYLKN